MFKRHNFKIFRCNPTDPSFNTHNFLGEINSYITKLREKEAVNLVINKIADFKKIIVITKSKELKRYAKSILPNHKEWKTQSNIKPIKTGKELGTAYCLGSKVYTHNSKPHEIKMANKYLGKNQTA